MNTASAVHAFPAIAEGQSIRSTAPTFNAIISLQIGPLSAVGPERPPAKCGFRGGGGGP